MAIRSLTAWHVRIPLKKKVRHASHSRTFTDSLVVQCRLTSGEVGWGEGLPREYVTGESIESAIKQLSGTDFGSQLAGMKCNPDSVLQTLDELRLEGEGTDVRGRSGNSVRCAVELAILDATCRAATVPLSRVTEWLPETEPIRQRASRVCYSGAITAGSVGKQYHQALKMRVFSFGQVKVKIGTTGVDDAALLTRVRRVVGEHMQLRVDANEAWSADNAVERINTLSGFMVSSVEQPLPAGEEHHLRQIRETTGMPIVLDESLCTEFDAQSAIDGQSCDLFNIRLSKCGGFVRSLRLAALARGAGVGYQLGCQVGETGILSAAGRHFACSVAGIRYLEGSYDRFLVRERLTKQDLTFGYGGWAPALTEPGLGITVDESAIKRCAHSELNWSINDG